MGGWFWWFEDIDKCKEQKAQKIKRIERVKRNNETRIIKSSSDATRMNRKRQKEQRRTYAQCHFFVVRPSSFFTLSGMCLRAWGIEDCAAQYGPLTLALFGNGHGMVIVGSELAGFVVGEKPWRPCGVLATVVEWQAPTNLLCT